MSLFAESLKRLYAKGRVTKDRITALAENGKITAAEAVYILGESEA